MAIVWTRRLATGLEWQDNEHKEMFARIDRLIEAMMHHQARNELDDLFQFLESYIERHFAHEEDFMLKCNFPGYMAHRFEHEDFAEHYLALKQAYDRQGASSYVVMRMQRWLSDWLLQHISRIDRELAVYANQQAASPA